MLLASPRTKRTEPKLEIVFCFSWEGVHAAEPGITGCCPTCPNCGKTTAFVYADRLLSHEEAAAIGEGVLTRPKLAFVIRRITEVLLHELVHGVGGGDEEAASWAEVLADT